MYRYVQYDRLVYKFLLCVLADQSRQRREVVRRKTAEYLSHAEELYQKHLADDEEDKVRSLTCYTVPLAPSLLVSTISM